jgi:hypothetical protein
MSVSEQRLRDWIEKADHDLGTAIVINQHIPDTSIPLSASRRKVHKMPFREKLHTIQA